MTLWRVGRGGWRKGWEENRRGKVRKGGERERKMPQDLLVCRPKVYIIIIQPKR